MGNLFADRAGAVWQQVSDVSVSGAPIRRSLDVIETEAEKKTKKVYGEVYIDRERCKGCSFCVEFCPPRCLELDKAYNSNQI